MIASSQQSVNQKQQSRIWENEIVTNTKPRDVQAIYIADETFALRSRSWNRLRFEIEYAL